jgi:putative spermidine/putrescine transport system substrate-binding protein
MSYYDEIGIYYQLGRRRFLKRAGASALALAAGSSALIRKSKPAPAQDNVIRMMGVTTVALPDWSQFEADTGLKMEFTPIDDNIGIFYHEVKANDAGDRYDLFAQLTGVYPSLRDEGYIMSLDPTQMPLWAGASKDVTESPLLLSTTAAGVASYGVPLVFNADTFGYFPVKLNEPRPPEAVSFDLVFDNQKTMGLVGLDDSFFTLTYAAGFMKGRGLAQIDKPADLTPEECVVVADYLIERKKAGQFRTFWATFEEQVSLFVNEEVLASICWEPGVKDAQRQGADVEFATCHEGFAKWMIAGFIPTQVKERGNIANVYKALDWFLGGAYAAEIAGLRGYATARPDLALDYAAANNWTDDQVQVIHDNIHKIKVKFAHPEWWDSGVPRYLEAFEREMDRFRNA